MTQEHEPRPTSEPAELVPGSMEVDESAEAADVDKAGDAEGARPNRLPEIPIAELATVASRADLDRVLASHAQWIAGTLDPKIQVAAGRANLKGVDLRDYDLSGVNLAGASLAGANLTGCDLSGANLSAADLTGACLACADLTHAKLRGARIDGADLRGADLTGAVTTGVDLSKAVLRSPEAVEQVAEAEAEAATPAASGGDPVAADATAP